MSVMVSVWMIAYNHEKFIRQAVESVMTQQTDFGFNLVIGEDCSTDNTRPLLLELQNNYPGRIKLLLHEKNVGMHRNVAMTLDACTGKYVALLEGDDYWTDPLKLQKQVSFLENNPDYVMCYHKELEIYDNQPDRQPKITNTQDRPETNLEEILERGWFIRTASMMFRNHTIDVLPEWFYKYPSTDYILHVLIARHGKIKLLDEVMAVQRRHEGGITKTSSYHPKNLNVRKIELLKIIDGFFEYKYTREISRHIQSLYNGLFWIVLGSVGSFNDVRLLVRLSGKANWGYIIHRLYAAVRNKIA